MTESDNKFNSEFSGGAPKSMGMLDGKSADECRAAYAALLSENAELNAKYAIVENQYNVISNSGFWKITKPARVLLDVVKKILKKFPPTHFLGKLVKRVLKGNRKKASAMPHTVNDLAQERNSVFSINPKFSILVPLYNTPERFLRELIECVQAQTYGNWELCLADGSDSKHPEVEKIAQEYAKCDPRVKYARLEKNEGISGNTNKCAEMASGDYLAFLDHDDLLSPSALYMNVKAIEQTDADVIYSDEDHITEAGEHVNPFYKPDFSRDLLYSQMYICHFTVVRKSLFDKLGGFDSAYDGSQDYDLMLRLTELTENICHIPAVLYHWRETANSTAANADAKPYAHEAGRSALDAHLKRRYGDMARAEDGDYLFCFEPRFDNLGSNPKVSIIMPMKDHADLSDACVRSILDKTDYPNYEIVVLDNRSEEKKTFAWFERVVNLDPRVRVIKADMEFNWSKINNFGTRNSDGEILVFLNNDTLVISPDWLRRISENALRPDVGAVGALLVYEDNTIQHAGVVVGMGGMADHVFKGKATEHFGAPYVSPMVSRNALAVTGACLAISREKLDLIGGFDESFIICGSDVELCLRAYEYGFNNLYNAKVKLYHLESKSRNTYIPPIDFKRSLQAYGPYLSDGDPYFNPNLDLFSLIPREEAIPLNTVKIKRFLKRIPPIAAAARALRRELMPPAEVNIPEIQPINARCDSLDKGAVRLNFLTPSVDIAHVFGGISTAMNFFEALRKELGCEARIISTDADVVAKTSTAPEEYKTVSMQEDSGEPYQLVAINDRYNRTLPVRKNDVFVCTAWWTAYTIRPVIDWQKSELGLDKEHPIVYIIQDYEPGFYPWSSRYMMADSTYRFDIPTYAVVNSKLLYDFLKERNYSFAKACYFEPILNRKLAAYLPVESNRVKKKKQILVYGRPSIDRNAFAIVAETLKIWREKMPEANEWTLFSAGEAHGDVDLGGNSYLQSLGKLSLEEYAKLMLDTYAGLSLMVSPHPSYPPLEMSTFGVKTVTNCYANKDLSSFNGNMVSSADGSPRALAEALVEICKAYDGEGVIENDNDYAKGGAPFGTAVDEISKRLKSDYGI